MHSENKIKNTLYSLRNIKASAKLRSHFENVLVPSLPKEIQIPIYSSFYLKLAFIILLFILVAASGAVVASAHSKPGSLLYPIKQVVDEIKNKLVLRPEGLSPKTQNDIQSVESTQTPETKTLENELNLNDKTKTNIDKIPDKSIGSPQQTVDPIIQKVTQNTQESSQNLETKTTETVNSTTNTVNNTVNTATETVTATQQNTQGVLNNIGL